VATLFLCSYEHRNPLRFSNESLRSTYFLPTAAKSKQKVPLEGNALHPLIYSFLQVVIIRSRRAITQSPVLGD
jgi:hypothetical protein